MASSRASPLRSASGFRFGQIGIVVNLTGSLIFAFALVRAIQAASATTQLSSALSEVYYQTGITGAALLAQASSLESTTFYLAALLIGAQALVFGVMCERFWNAYRRNNTAKIMRAACVSAAIGLASVAIYVYFGLFLLQANQSACDTLFSLCASSSTSTLSLGLLIFAPFAGVANILFATIARKEVGAGSRND